MARYRLPNYIARRTNWTIIFSPWFWISFLMEAFFVVAHLGILPIKLPNMLLFGILEWNLWTVILAGWSIVVAIYLIVNLIIIRCDYVEFYDSYVIEKEGVIWRKSKKTIFPQITGVTTHRNILGYGEVNVDVVGPWDVNLEKIKRPEDVREYLVDHMVNSVAVENIGNNPYIASLTASIF